MAKTLEGRNRNPEAHQKKAGAVTAADGSNAVITLQGVAGHYHILSKLWFSISVAGASKITIDWGDSDATPDFDIDVTAAGMGPLDLGMMAAGEGNTVTITLVGAGSSAQKIYLLYY